MTGPAFADYDLDGVLGNGTFGTVYRATHRRTGVAVAVKILDGAGDPAAARDRLRNEVAALRQVDDEHCVRVRDVIDTVPPAIVTDYIDGAPLRAVLDRAGTLTGPQALDVMRGALTGLAAVHRAGLLHGDVKPDNVLLDRAGVSRLIDFGLARTVAGSGPSITGSPAYASPEQAAGAVVDARSDIYSCATVLFELLTGHRPFAGTSADEVHRRHIEDAVPDPRQVSPAVSAALAGVCMTGMAKEPGDRYQTVDEFLAALTEAARKTYGAAWATGTGLGAVVGTVLGATAATKLAEGKGAERPRRSVPHPRLIGAAVLGAAVVIAVVLAVLLIPSHHPSRPQAVNPGPARTGSGTTQGPGPVLAAATQRFVAPPAVTANVYFAVSCPTDLICLATGQTAAGRPLVSTTTDAGAHWTTQYPVVPGTLGLLSCSDPSTCVAGYFDTAIHMRRTTDGGATWTTAPTPDVTNLQSISCPSATDCLAVGGGSTNGTGTAQAIATTDGGRDWRRVTVPGPATSVSCPDVTHCWAAGSASMVWATADLGASWHAVSPPSTFPPGAAVGPFPAGTTFPATSRIGELGFYAAGVAFGSDTDGIAFGGAICGGYRVTKCPAGVYRTTDGARSWTWWPAANSDTYGFASWAACRNLDCLVVADTVTASTLISTTDGRVWTRRQDFGSLAGRVSCSRDAATCVVIGHTGLWVAHA